jgi:hypothetical protein
MTLVILVVAIQDNTLILVAGEAKTAYRDTLFVEVI